MKKNFYLKEKKPEEKPRRNFAKVVQDLQKSRKKNSGRLKAPCKLPGFPLIPERLAFHSPEAVKQRQDMLENYLTKVLHIPAYRNHPETVKS